VAPRGSGTRPMADRVREALFSSLADRVPQSRVLDLYAGSGSLGLEALSRGASFTVFVERNPAALTALRRNLSAVRMGGEVVAGDVGPFLGRCDARFDLVFVDPPYALSLASVGEVLGRLTPLLENGATVVLHRRKGEEAPPAQEGLVAVDDRVYGDSRLWILRKETK